MKQPMSPTKSRVQRVDVDLEVYEEFIWLYQVASIGADSLTAVNKNTIKGLSTAEGGRGHVIT